MDGIEIRATVDPFRSARRMMVVMMVKNFASGGDRHVSRARDMMMVTMVMLH